MKRDNITAVTIKFSNLFVNTVDDEKIYNELLKHPDYPSMLSVSDVLTASGIENQAYIIEDKDVRQLPAPFVAHTYDGRLVVIKKMNENAVFISDENADNQQLSIDDFKKTFDGVVLTTAQQPGSTKSVSHKLKTGLVYAPYILLLLILFSGLAMSGFFSGIDLLSGLFAFIKSLGLIVSLLLLIRSVNTENKWVKKFCKNDDKTNCDAILSSDAAKAFAGLTWSDIGFFYFSGTWVLFLFGDRSAQVWQLLSVLNFISLPFTFYSVYYQKTIAKQWCVLCTSIQAILWLEAICLILKIWQDRSFLTYSYHAILRVLPEVFVALAFPFCCWVLLKAILKKAQEVHTLKQQLNKFKFNPELFYQVLHKEIKTALPDPAWSIMIGASEPAAVITLVSNPYCPPCSQAHAEVTELLKQRDDLQVQILFAIRDEADTIICSHIMALNKSMDGTKIEEALQYWYNESPKDYAQFAKRYPVEIDRSVSDQITLQNAWCHSAAIDRTPTLLVNGHPLPDIYTLQDVKFML